MPIQTHNFAFNDTIETRLYATIAKVKTVPQSQSDFNQL
jgi:hypothetical protein